MSDSQPKADPGAKRLSLEEKRGLALIRAVWNRKPHEPARAEQAVALAAVRHHVPIECVAQALGLPYARVVRIIKRETGKMPSALAILDARSAKLISKEEMIALLSNRSYDPPLRDGTGRVELRDHPNSVSVLQRAYLRGMVTQGELWAIGDSITVRQTSE